MGYAVTSVSREVFSGTPHPGPIRSSHQVRDKLTMGRPGYFPLILPREGTFTCWKGASVNIYQGPPWCRGPELGNGRNVQPV